MKMQKSIISNVRRSSICWRNGGIDGTGRQKTRNHGYDVIVAIEPLPSHPDHLLQTCHAKPKTQINRRRTLPASSRWWDAYRKQLGLERLLSEKSGRCGIAAD